MVGVIGFEPTAPWSQTKCATGLRYTPTRLFYVACEWSQTTIATGLHYACRMLKYTFCLHYSPVILK